MQKTIQAPELHAYVATVLIAAGSSAEEAESIAANLVLANLSGHDSHGVGMLPRYVNAVLEGGLQPNTAVRVLLGTGSRRRARCGSRTTKAGASSPAR